MQIIKKTGFSIYFFVLMYFFTSCTAEVEPMVVDNIHGETIRYTVLVVPGGNTSFKSTLGIDSAVVSLVMNDSIYSIATDDNGLVTFNNLASGVAAVTIKYPNHTTANFMVDLSAKKDSTYSESNLRNAATMVALFPLSGEGTATISGRAFAELDLTTAGLENAPAGIKVTTLLESSQLLNYVNHTGEGEILSINYEQATNSTTSNSGSDYTIVVPATASGLKIVLSANDFVYDQITGPGTTQRKVYNVPTDTISVASGITYFKDLIYN